MLDKVSETINYINILNIESLIQIYYKIRIASNIFKRDSSKFC